MRDLFDGETEHTEDGIIELQAERTERAFDALASWLDAALAEDVEAVATGRTRAPIVPQLPEETARDAARLHLARIRWRARKGIALLC